MVARLRADPHGPTSGGPAHPRWRPGSVLWGPACGVRLGGPPAVRGGIQPNVRSRVTRAEVCRAESFPRSSTDIRPSMRSPRLSCPASLVAMVEAQGLRPERHSRNPDSASDIDEFPLYVRTDLRPQFLAGRHVHRSSKQFFQIGLSTEIASPVGRNVEAHQDVHITFAGGLTTGKRTIEPHLDYAEGVVRAPSCVPRSRFRTSSLFMIVPVNHSNLFGSSNLVDIHK